MSTTGLEVNGGELQDYTIDQFAGALALSLGAIDADGKTAGAATSLARALCARSVAVKAAAQPCPPP